MKLEHARVVYILGYPYSGSTLFAVALGNGEGLVNLGEVSSLENDYQESTRCLCGNCLSECEFWQGIKVLLDEKQKAIPAGRRFQINREGVLSGPDQRHLPFVTRLKLLMGANKAFSETELENYAKKNELFLNTVSEFSGGKMIVDASKSAYRLPILLQRTDLDIKVIWLQRSMKGLFSSKLRRVKLRSRFYIPILSHLVTMAWLLSYYWVCERVYTSLPGEQKCIIPYEDFLQGPEAVQDVLTGFLGTAVNFKIQPDNSMPIVDHHVYVGNRWLYKHRGSTEIRINANASKEELGSLEKTLYQACSIFFPVLKG